MKAKKLAVAVLAALMATSMVGCGGGQKKEEAKKPAASAEVKGTITGSGSSALLPLVKDAAEKFKAKNKDVSITLNAGGSGTGLKQVSDGSVDMGNSDVPAETKLPKDKASKLKDHKICVMTVVPIINKDVQVKNLTKQQLTDIFTAKITNWKEVGGPDKPIILVTAIMSTNGTLQLYDESVNLTQGGPANATITMSHYIYNTTFISNPNFGYAAAMSFVVLILVAILSVIQMKVGDKR